MKPARKTVAPAPRPTRALLVEAAAAEFNAHGFHGTDTNRIARRAGFAPQTFYRHFADKTDVFIEVYARWWASEQADVARAVRGTPSERRSLAIASALLASHRAWRGFRRSLRLLAVEDERVRKARAKGRLAQLAALDPRPPSPDRIAALLTVERLCDAAADEETADLGVDAQAWRAIVAAAVESLGAAAP